jgi:uncharacterized membrane protein
MIFKIFSVIVAAVLVVAFVWPVIFKLKEIPLFIVAAIGIAMMVREFWEELREKKD